MNIPRRQSFPILLILALSLWASCALFYSLLKEDILSQIIFDNKIWALLIAILFIFISAFLFIKSNKNKNIYIIFIGIWLGFILALIGTNNLIKQQNEILNLPENTYAFIVEEDQKSGSIYNSCTAHIDNNDLNKYKIKLQFSQDFEEIHAGDLIKAQAKFYTITQNQEQNYWQNAICGNAQISKPQKLERYDLFGIVYKYRNHLIDTIRQLDKDNPDSVSQSCSLLGAIVCGQRIDLNSIDLYDSFKNSGLAHLVAVSGAHLSLVIAILLIILKRLKLKKWIVIFIQSVFILAYLICAAIPISALRAAIMAYIAIFSFFSRRRPAPLNALAVCIIALTALNPETSVSVSFALSAGSTLGIILYSSLFEYYIQKIIPKCPELITSALSLTFSASICSQPLSISKFNQFPIISPVANIICTPIFSVLCGFGLISSVFASIFNDLLPIISSCLLNISNMLSQLLSQIVQFLAHLPYASIPASSNIYVSIAISILISFILYVTWPKKSDKHFENPIGKKIKKTKIIITSALIVAGISAFIIIIPSQAQTEISALDVGQGDSILIKSKGKNFLIDTGNQDNLLKTRLAEKGISHLDALFITHPDDDHCASIKVLQQLVQVDNVYVASDMLSSNDSKCKELVLKLKQINNTKIQGLNVGDRIVYGEVELNIIWPDKYKENGGNCDSLCILANIDVNNDDTIDANALLCGDAEKDEIDAMLKKKRISKLDIYKCGHHGSKNAISDTSVRQLVPKITLISVGSKNRYGHPAKSTIDQLKHINSIIYRTDEQGTITCCFSNSGIKVETAK